MRKLTLLLSELGPNKKTILTKHQKRELLFNNIIPINLNVTAKQKRIIELMREARTEYLHDADLLSDPDAAASYCQAIIGNKKREHFLAVALDAKNRVIAHSVMFSGTIDRSAVYPREVAKWALLNDARALIVAHNHPSQDTAPSASDNTLTQSLIAALKTVDVVLHDHIIVSATENTSIRQRCKHFWY